MKIAIAKMTADGEQVSCEVVIEKDTMRALAKDQIALRTHLDPFFRLIDDRLSEMNRRVIAANYLITKLPADARMAIQNVLDVLHGRVPASQIDSLVQDTQNSMVRAREAAEKAQAAAAEAQAKVDEIVEGLPVDEQPVGA